MSKTRCWSHMQGTRKAIDRSKPKLHVTSRARCSRDYKASYTYRLHRLYTCFADVPFSSLLSSASNRSEAQLRSAESRHVLYVARTANDTYYRVRSAATSVNTNKYCI
jgi:hypothetical protein